MSETKHCHGCQRDLAPKDFAKNKWMKDGLQTRCKECRKQYKYKVNSEYQKEWASANKEKVKGYRLKAQYGLSLEEYDLMYKEVGGRCEICKEPHDILCVDHCHTTNEIRGLLCSQCNLGVGNLRDSVALLESAKEYLIE